MNFFNENNIVNIVLNKIGDVIVANILFLLCSIPLVTIGPSLTALYHCTLRIVKDNNPGTAKTFFRAFRENFRQSLIAWLFFLAAAFLFALNIRFLLAQDSSAGKFLLYLSAAAAGFLIIEALYLFPVIAAFSGTLKAQAKNAFLFAFLHFPSTLLIAVITLLPMFMTYRDLNLLPLYAFCWFFFGFGLTALLNSFLFYRMFKPYLEQETPQESA